jgi:hypothetical protein
MTDEGESTTLGTGQQKAIDSAHLDDITKRINVKFWSDNMEKLIADWGEKAAGLRFMHSHSGASWKKFANNLALGGILVTSLASSISLIATNIEDQDVKNGILYGVGGIGLLSTLIQSLKKFYNAEEKAAQHASVAKQFGTFYRYITMQMNISREEREPADILIAYTLKEYERLHQEAPLLLNDSIKVFKAKFMNGEQTVPDVAEDKFVITVTKSSIPLEPERNVIKPPIKDIKLGTSGL